MPIQSAASILDAIAKELDAASPHMDESELLAAQRRLRELFTRLVRYTDIPLSFQGLVDFLSPMFLPDFGPHMLAQARKTLAELREELSDNGTAAVPEDGRLALAPGGYTFRGEDYPLKGKAREMLKVLLKARRHIADLKMLLNPDPSKPGEKLLLEPEQSVKDHISDLRKALRETAKDFGLKLRDPVPCVGRRPDLAYRLAPEFFAKS
jgi:hypothetical protein